MPDLVFRDNLLLDEWVEDAPAGPEDGASRAEPCPGTVALIVAALLGVEPSVRQPRSGLWKRMGLLGLMAGRPERL